MIITQSQMTATLLLSQDLSQNITVIYLYFFSTQLENGK